MFYEKFRALLHTFAAIVLLALLLSGCKPIAREPSEPIPDSNSGDNQDVENKLQDVWVNDQLILIGSHSAVEQAAADLNIQPLEGVEALELGQLITNDFVLNPDQSTNRETLPAVLQQIFQINLNNEQIERISNGDLMAQVYDLSQQQIPVNDAIEKVNGIRDAFQEEFDRGFVFAQPNFWVTPVQAQSVTVCQGIGGAPTPNTVGGGSYGDAQMDASLTSQAFHEQPALLAMTDGIPNALNNGAMGDGVKIAIFDTSPFTNVSEGANYDINQVIHRPAQTQAITMATLKNEHGLFVASLTRAVAPKSEIDLIRVLDSATCGVVYDLNGGLFNLLISTGKQEPLVINFSLVYKLGTQPDSAKDYLTSLLLKIGTERPKTIAVAASGNQGTWNAAPPPPLYPAAYFTSTQVIAVASTNPVTGLLSCYSNIGSVSASGGEGNATLCTGPSANPAENLIGATTSGFARWSGTSFAAPLVSGLAARCLSSGLSATQTIANLDSGPGIDEVTLAMCPPPQ